MSLDPSVEDARNAKLTSDGYYPGADQPEIRTEESVTSSLRCWEDLRGLLGRVLNEVEDLHPELRQAIERALAS